MSCKLNPHIKQYIDEIESGAVRSCEEQKKLVAYVRKCFETEDIYTDDEQLEHYLSLAKYFPFDQLFPWEEFVEALHLCTYRRSDEMPRWPDLFCLIGRGAGKDGLIAHEATCLTSPYNGIPHYDVDICANNEEQAMRPVLDIIEAFEAPEQVKKLKRHYYWTKERVTSLKTRSPILGRTNNPKGKDGLRSGIVIFNEIHQYENYANIDVFTTGLGKKKHPRRDYYTTQGYVRDGPLDDLLDQSERILNGEQPDNGLLPFICKIDSRDEVSDPENWVKANPSLPYRPDLRMEIEKEFNGWQDHPERLPAFMTKRMNLPDVQSAKPVTEWAHIEATNRPMPELRGKSCTVGIDYSSLRDWAAVNLHFRDGDNRFDIGRYWCNVRNPDLSRIRAPWKSWDTVVPVDAVEIAPELIGAYLFEAAQSYQLTTVCMDNFRFATLREALEKYGFDSDKKGRNNIYLARPSDIMKAQPIIDSCFNNDLFVWGDNPALRWAVNNTSLLRRGREDGTDTGNFYYGKIEAKSRKTDPFMALVFSMIVEDQLAAAPAHYDNLPVIVV